MMHVYLDTNIVVAIESGEYSLNDVLNHFPEKPILSYSPAHIFEVQEIINGSSSTRDKFIEKRLNTLRTIFGNRYRYFHPNGSGIIGHEIDPVDVFNQITSFPEGLAWIKSLNNSVSEPEKNLMRIALGFKPIVLNNLEPAALLNEVNERLSALGMRGSISEIIQQAIALHGPSSQAGLYENIASVFALLDAFGFWRDKPTEASNIARFYDSLHCFFASECDYFVTNDKRALQKSIVIYHAFGIKTKSISMNYNFKQF